MKITTVSYQSKYSKEENITTISELVTKIKIEQETDFIFFGELALSNYIISKDYLELNSVSLDGKEIETMKNVAKKNCVCISFGYSEKAHDNYYNSQIVIDQNGCVVYNHRKNNLTNKERLFFSEGKTPVSFFVLNNFQYAISICFDMFGPTFHKQYKSKQATIFLHALTDPQDAKFALGFSGRSTLAYYIAANRFGTENTTYYNGHIGIYSPTGKKIGLMSDQEGILSSNIIDKKRNKTFLKIVNTFKIGIHLILHLKKVINYLAWSTKNKNTKNKKG